MGSTSKLINHLSYHLNIVYLFIIVIYCFFYLKIHQNNLCSCFNNNMLKPLKNTIKTLTSDAFKGNALLKHTKKTKVITFSYTHIKKLDRRGFFFCKYIIFIYLMIYLISNKKEIPENKNLILIHHDCFFSINNSIHNLNYTRRISLFHSTIVTLWAS